MFCWIIIYLQCDIDVVLFFAADWVATDLTVLGINGDQNQNGVNVTEGGRGEAKTICPKRRLAFYCTTWTALSPILSIKPVSSRAPGRSRLFPRTCDHVVIVIAIVHKLHHVLLWSPSAPTKKDKVTRIGIPASCGRSRRLCSSLRLACHQRHQYRFKSF